MGSAFAFLLDPSGLTPHGFCLLWEPGLIWLQAVSDGLVGLSYFSIPLALAMLVRRRRDLVFTWMFWLFAAFIFACGSTHFLAVLTLWEPAYWLEGGVKAITAVLSVATAVTMWPLLPRVIALPSPDALRQANAALSRQIEERDLVASRLRESEARYRALYLNTPASLHTLDMSGRVTAASRYWLDLLGYAEGEVLGRHIAEFNAPASAEAVRQEWAALLRRRAARDLERRMVRKDGEVLDVLVSFEIERGEAGGAERVLCSVVDVTARKRAEAALRASEERLRQSQKMEAIGQLTGGIAHDFNNMLTVIGGSLELLRRRVPDAANVQRLVDAASSAAGKAAKLTAQLLSFSRKQRLEPQSLDAAEVVEGMTELLARTLGETIRLEVPPPAPDQWRCYADRNGIETALLNLVLNARAAMAGRGCVSIGIANALIGEDDRAGEEPGEEPLPPGDYVRISVRDDGAGMSEEVRRRAFEPFFTTKPPGEGTGLGLSQIYGFMRQSGGAARIQSAPGCGTRIDLFLPRAEAESETATRPSEAGPIAKARRHEHVLVVEDEPGVRQFAVEALESLGYRVMPAADADEALRLLAGSQPADLLFTDVRMPGSRNGVELAMAARAVRRGLRVLFATGYSDQGLLSPWPEELRVVQKPYGLDGLAAQVRAALDDAPASASG